MNKTLIIFGLLVNFAVLSSAVASAPDISNIQAKAERGEAGAQLELSDLFYGGRGVAKDYAEAVKWCRKAAEQGYDLAQLKLGSFYHQGQGVAQDYAEAYFWFSLGVNHESNYDAARNYALKQLTPEQLDAVQKRLQAWWRQAAEQPGWGQADAQYHLGDLYATGLGVAKDDVEAAKWYRKAADQIYHSAKYKLGDLYAKGQGVPQDYVEAYYWYSLGMNQQNNYDDYAKERDAVAKQLTPDQITAVQKRVKEWQPTSK
ncbi:MAG: sel1 repeat family protein [Proteobacteria bacterium]|nr:sel1 repeat family protein [Pseudomonadota bacterium]